jgi:transcriptional regulator with XRE-family HTH domain
MATLTPFGVALRKLRIEKNLRLIDVADRLGKSTALLSAIETGRKPIPDMFLLELARALSLVPAEVRELRSAKEQTRKNVDVTHLRGDQREMVAAFARRIEDIPEDVLKNLRKSILEARGGEVPFERKRRGILVSPRSQTQIEELSWKIRTIFCGDGPGSIPVVDIIEFRIPEVIRDFCFEVWSVRDMDGDEGRVIAGENRLILREDVYEKACRGEGRARFTACHELGHYVMHSQIAFARVRDDHEPIFRDAEWQADTFASSLLLPRRHSKLYCSAAMPRPDAV